MGRPRKKRRNPQGSAWHWKQTDCWYYTLPGTKKRMPLFDEDGERIRGTDNQESAEHALASSRYLAISIPAKPQIKNGSWPEYARNTCSIANGAWPPAR